MSPMRWEDTKDGLERVFEDDRPCPYCGSTLFKIEPPKGPHSYHLRCMECGRGGRWLPYNFDLFGEDE
jgi:hypothetical protein